MLDPHPEGQARGAGQVDSRGAQAERGRSKKLILLSSIYSRHVRPHTCPEDYESRLVCGCDEPTAKAGWGLLCWRCLGESNQESVCQKCKGMGKVPQHRCPNATLRPEGSELFQVYRRFKMYGDLPMSGGLYAQAAIVLKTLELCDKTIFQLDRKREEMNQWLRDKAAQRKQESDVG